jgi:hypothetical protein
VLKREEFINSRLIFTDMAKKHAGMKMTVGVGAGLAAAGAAGAAAYWLYGAKHSAQHRKMAKSWMLKARAEALEAIEKIQDIDKAQYMAAVNGVLKNYAGKAGTSSAEVAHMMRDFKTAWTHIQAAQKSGTKGAKTAKRVSKKAVKKARTGLSKRK